MIRNEAEYQEALRRLEEDRRVATAQREALAATGLMPDEVERAMEPLLSFQAQLQEEISWYEDVRRRNFPVIRRLTQIGRSARHGVSSGSRRGERDGRRREQKHGGHRDRHEPQAPGACLHATRATGRRVGFTCGS